MRTSSVPLRLSLAFTLGLLLVACARRDETVAKPSAPNVDAVVAEFDSPTLPLDEDVARTLRAVVEETVELIGGLEIESEALDPILEALEEGEAEMAEAHIGPSTKPANVRRRRQEVALEGTGFMRVTRICPGFGEPVVDEETNGKSVAIVGFTEDGLDPELWVDFSACRYSSSLGQVEIVGAGEGAEAAVVLALGGPVAPGELQTRAIVYVVDLDTVIDETARSIEIAFRHVPLEQSYEILLRSSEGTAVLLTEGNSLVGVRASNGTYSCDAEEGTCTDADGVSFDF